MRVKSYTVAMVTPAWCFVGKHFMTSFMVTTPFLVGGGCRIRAGAFGGKPKVSIWEKFTAACWHEQVKIMIVSRCLSSGMLLTDTGKPWHFSPLRTGYPLLWRSRIHAWSSVSCEELLNHYFKRPGWNSWNRCFCINIKGCKIYSLRINGWRCTNKLYPNEQRLSDTRVV